MDQLDPSEKGSGNMSLSASHDVKARVMMAFCTPMKVCAT